MLKPVLNTSVKILTYLKEREPELCSGPELAEALSISISHLEHIARNLREAGLIRSVKGPGGGYALQREHILLKEVVQAFECDINLTNLEWGILRECSIDIFDLQMTFLPSEAV